MITQEYVAENSSPLSLKVKNSLHYNLSHTQDCPTNFFRSWKSIFSQVFLKDHQVSFSRFLEHADQLLRETFEMFFSRSHYHSDH